MKQLLSAVAVAVALLSLSASGATQGPYVLTAGPTLTDEEVNLLLPKYTPVVGNDLIKVSYDLEVRVFGSIGGENTAPTPTIMHLMLGADVTTTLFPTISIVSVDESFAVSSFDGTIDYAGTSGETFPGDDTETESGFYQGPLQLAPFQGPGNLPITISGDSLSTAIIESGNGESLAMTRFQAELRVTYEYQPRGREIIPESSTWIGMTSLAGIGFLGWRRMRKTDH